MWNDHHSCPARIDRSLCSPNWPFAGGQERSAWTRFHSLCSQTRGWATRYCPSVWRHSRSRRVAPASSRRYCSHTTVNNSTVSSYKLLKRNCNENSDTPTSLLATIQSTNAFCLGNHEVPSHINLGEKQPAEPLDAVDVVTMNVARAEVRVVLSRRREVTAGVPSTHAQCFTRATAFIQVQWTLSERQVLAH